MPSSLLIVVHAPGRFSKMADNVETHEVQSENDSRVEDDIINDEEIREIENSVTEGAEKENRDDQNHPPSPPDQPVLTEHPTKVARDTGDGKSHPPSPFQSPARTETHSKRKRNSPSSMKKSSKKRSRRSSSESSTSSSSDSSSSSSSSSSGSNRRKSKKAKKAKKKSSKIAKKKGYNPKRFFKIEKKEDKNSWKVDNNFACYANDMIKSFIKDSDVKSSILEKLPVPSNIKEVQDVDLWLLLYIVFTLNCVNIPIFTYLVSGSINYILDYDVVLQFESGDDNLTNLHLVCSLQLSTDSL